MAYLFLNQKFQTFKEFEAAKKSYEDSKFMKWSTYKSYSIAKANRDIRNRGDNNFYKEELEHQNIKYCCKFGGPTRIGSGRGIRVYQETFKRNCPAKLHLIASRNELRVTKLVEEHNHDIFKEGFDALPENRHLPEEAEEKVRLLMEGNVKPAVIRSLLRDVVGNVTSRDLANLRAKWAREKTNGASEEERIISVLEEILEMDPGCSINVGKNSEGMPDFLFIQTSGMRRNVSKYGKVLMLDHTYKINKNKMPVCVMMVMDGHGSGRSAGFAFVANEKVETVTSVLQCFKDSVGEEVANRVKTVVIDKDPSEIAAISAIFPEAQTQLCAFHVKKVFHEQCRAHKEGEATKKILDKLMYCQEVEEFDELVKELEEVASPGFFQYFRDNWENCRQAWSFKDKKMSINLGNGTTNRVETINGKLKVLSNSNSTVADCLDGILNLVKNKEEDVTFRETTESLKISYMTTALNDPTTNEVLNSLTKFAAKLLVWELSNIPEEPEIVRYGATETTCTCQHRWSYELPCRHMFQCRRMAGSSVYTIEEIEPMWHRTKSSERGNVLGDEDVPSSSVSVQIVKRSAAPIKTSQQKYNAAMNKAKLLCTLLSECGTQQFSNRLPVFDELLKIWASGNEVCVKENSSENVITALLEENIPILQGEIVPCDVEYVTEDVVSQAEAGIGIISNNKSPQPRRERPFSLISQAASGKEVSSNNIFSQPRKERPFTVISQAASGSKVSSNKFSQPRRESAIRISISSGSDSDEDTTPAPLPKREPEDSGTEFDFNTHFPADFSQSGTLPNVLRSGVAAGSQSLSEVASGSLSDVFRSGVAADSQANLSQSEVASGSLQCDKSSGEKIPCIYILTDSDSDLDLDSDAPTPTIKIEPEDGNTDCNANVVPMMSMNSNKSNDNESNENSDLWDYGIDNASLQELVEAAEEEERVNSNFNHEPDVGNANLQALAEAIEEDERVTQTAPLCFCRPSMPTIRQITSQNGTKMAGRPYYSCAKKLCTFWRIAKSEPWGIQKIMEGIRLPLVKTKGRPKGINRTSKIKYTQKPKSSAAEANSNSTLPTKPSGAFFTPCQLAHSLEQERQQKGASIDTEDCSKNLDGSWTVVSQSDHSTKYRVTTSSCTCPDRLRSNIQACKHMYKVKKLQETASLVNIRKRKAVDESLNSQHEMSSSQTTRSGRTVQKKLPYTPTKM